jgi:putative hemolysin
LDSDSFLCQLAGLFDGITVTPPDFGAVVAILFAAFLLLVSGFVSASEIAFFSLNPNDKNEIEQGNTASDKKIQLLLEDSERLLATILITNNFVNVSCCAITFLPM